MPFSDDDYSRQGMAYFERIYGRCISDSDIEIVYETETPPPEEEPEICGWIRFRESELPVIYAPTPIGTAGEPFCTYVSPEAVFDCIVHTSDAMRVGIDLFRHIGFFLAGELELIWKKNDSLRKKTVQYPFTDLYGRLLYEIVRKACHIAGTPLIRPALWPDGMKYAVCLTHDVDEIKKTYQWITHPLRCIVQKDKEGLANQIAAFRQKVSGSEPYWTFEDILRMEHEAGGRSSFYFLREDGEVIVSDVKTWRHQGRKYDWHDERVSGILRRLDAEGWEVGLHGSFYSYDKAGKLADELRSLEDALGKPVRGGRQHNLNLSIPETWRIHESLHFLYDTTLGYNDCIGFRWGSCFPFMPYDTDQNRFIDLLEIPLIIEDLPLFREEDPWKAFLGMNGCVEDVGGVLTLLWHHSVLNATEFPSWTDCYKKILAYCRERNAWITSGIQIAKWWRSRSKLRYAVSIANRECIVFSCEPDQSPCVHIDFPEGVCIAEMQNAELISAAPYCSTIRLNPMKTGTAIILALTKRRM